MYTSHAYASKNDMTARMDMFLVCLSGPQFLRNDHSNDCQDSGCRISPHIWFALASILNSRN